MLTHVTQQKKSKNNGSHMNSYNFTDLFYNLIDSSSCIKQFKRGILYIMPPRILLTFQLASQCHFLFWQINMSTPNDTIQLKEQMSSNFSLNAHRFLTSLVTLNAAFEVLIAIVNLFHCNNVSHQVMESNTFEVLLCQGKVYQKHL